MIHPHLCDVRLNFYPRSPCGERPVRVEIFGVLCPFLSTLSLRRATLIWRYLTPKALKFLSTLSLRRATVRTSIPFRQCWNFYPRSPCGERQQAQGLKIPPLCISIHALLAESDLRVLDGSKSSIISIHALLAESDHQFPRQSPEKLGFLSTLSLRRATTEG